MCVFDLRHFAPLKGAVQIRVGLEAEKPPFCEPPSENDLRQRIFLQLAAPGALTKKVSTEGCLVAPSTG